MMLELYDRLTERLRGAGDWIAPLGIRFLLAYEFWGPGTGKLGAGREAPGWFAGTDFPFPFSVLSANLNWFLVTWGEILAAIALVLGLFTRFFTFTLIIITAVAIVSVHWPTSWDSLGQLWEGYSVSRVMEDGEFRGNFRIPFLFLAMMLPLLYWGGGKLSLDHLLVKFTNRGDLIHERRGDLATAALALLIPGLVLAFLIPLWGAILLVLAVALAVYHKVSG